MSVGEEAETLVIDLVAKDRLDLDSREMDACLQLTDRDHVTSEIEPSATSQTRLTDRSGWA